MTVGVGVDGVLFCCKPFVAYPVNQLIMSNVMVYVSGVGGAIGRQWWRWGSFLG